VVPGVHHQYQRSARCPWATHAASHSIADGAYSGSRLNDFSKKDKNDEK